MEARKIFLQERLSAELEAKVLTKKKSYTSSIFISIGSLSGPDSFFPSTPPYITLSLCPSHSQAVYLSLVSAKFRSTEEVLLSENCECFN